MSYVQRKVFFPIRLKLTLSVLSIVMLSLGFYVSWAIDLFKTDKLAYVFETVDKQNTQVSLLIESELKKISEIHEVMIELESVDYMLKRILKQNPQVVNYQSFYKGKIKTQIATLDINVADLIQKINTTSFYQLGDYLLHIIVNGDFKSFAAIKFDYLLSQLPKDNLYSYSLLSKRSETDEFINKTTIIKNQIVSENSILDRHFLVKTSVSYRDAIQASEYLVNKSLYFGGGFI